VPFGSFLAKRYGVARLLMWLDLRELKLSPTTLVQSIDSEAEVIYGARWSRAKALSHNTTNAVAVLREALRFRL